MTDLITKALCPDHERLDFLPHHVGSKFLHYENYIYGGMDKFCAGYQGGFWNYYTLSNGGFYMALDCGEQRFRVVQPMNFYDGEMSAEAASIGINLYAQNAFAWQVDAERFSDLFHKLRDFAAGHPEGAEIMAFID